MIIPVYRSQWGKGATRRVNDCGIACCAMFMGAIGDNTPIDALRTADPTGLTTAADLVRILSEHHIRARMDKLLGLDAVQPNSILLVNYDPLRKYAQDTAFKGWHWLIYLGLSSDVQSAITLDPDYYRERINEGDHKQYPLAAMRSAFRPYGSEKFATAVVVEDAIPVPPLQVGQVRTVVDVVNLRRWPAIPDKNSPSNVIRGLSAGETVIIYYIENNGIRDWCYVVDPRQRYWGWMVGEYLR